MTDLACIRLHRSWPIQVSWFRFLQRSAMMTASYSISASLSLCLSVKRRYRVKTNERRMMPSSLTVVFGKIRFINTFALAMELNETRVDLRGNFFTNKSRIGLLDMISHQDVSLFNFRQSLINVHPQSRTCWQHLRHRRVSKKSSLHQGSFEWQDEMRWGHGWKWMLDHWEALAFCDSFHTECSE